MQELTLKDCLAEWPPTNAAAAGHAPDFVKDDDLITHAKVSNKHRLVLGLKRDSTTFTTNVCVREQYTDLLTSAVKNLKGKTIKQAIAMVLDQA